MEKTSRHSLDHERKRSMDKPMRIFGTNTKKKSFSRRVFPIQNAVITSSNVYFCLETQSIDCCNEHKNIKIGRSTLKLIALCKLPQTQSLKGLCHVCYFVSVHDFENEVTRITKVEKLLTTRAKKINVKMAKLT